MQLTNISTSFNGNLSSNSTTTSQAFGYPALAACLVLGLCCLVGLPCNIAMIVTIVKRIRQMSLNAKRNFRHTSQDEKTSFLLKLLLSLAVSDSLSLSTIPLDIYVLLDEWTLGAWTCGLFTYVLYCCLYGSVLTVTLLGVQLYRGINNKAVNKMVQNSRTRQLKEQQNKMLLGLWVLVCVLALPTIFTRDVEDKRGRLRCHRCIMTDWGKVALLLIETFLGFVIPFSILVTSYFYFYQKYRYDVGKSQPRTKNQKAVPTILHMTKLVTSILVTFFLFWAPVYIINVVDIATTLVKTSQPQAFSRLKDFRSMFGDAVKALGFINSCLNPFLYAVLFERQIRNKSGQTSVPT